MEIITGRAISKSVIRNLLKPVPKYILKQVNKIVVSVVPDKKFKENNRRWGGYWGSTDEKTRIVHIYLYSIAENVNKVFDQHNNNWYHYAIESLARTLYWQIGIIDNPNTKKKVIKLDLTKFENDMVAKAEKMGILEPPSPKKIRFFKIWRDKFIDRRMNFLRKSDLFDTHANSVIDHLRKVKLGLKYKYTPSQLFTAMYGLSRYEYRYTLLRIYKEAHIHLNFDALYAYSEKEGARLYRNHLNKFKGLVSKIITPKCYISKSGLQYPFFTEKNLKKLKKEIKWKPIVEDAYVRNSDVRN